MNTLGDGLPRQMARVRDEILPVYDSMPAGIFAATMMRADLDRAAKAMIEGDVVEMLRVCESLRTRGLIEDAGDQLRITTVGLKALGSYTPLPSGRALFEHWLTQLSKAEREILRVLFEEWPASRPKEFVAMKAGYEAEGRWFTVATTTSVDPLPAKDDIAEKLQKIAHGVLSVDDAMNTDY